MTDTIYVQRHTNCFIDWGRHVAIDGKQVSYDGARVYMGEDAEIIALVLKHSPQPVRTPRVQSIEHGMI